MHAGSVGIENSGDFDRKIKLAMVIKEERLRAPLAFIITRAEADRIDIAPISFMLRMDLGIAVHFASRGLQNLRVQILSQRQAY